MTSLKAFWKPDGKKIDTHNQQRLRSAISKHFGKAMPITCVLHDPRLEKDRMEIAKHLNVK